jgi:hypothetical protein
MRAACQKQRAAALGCDPVQDGDVNVIKSGGQTPNRPRHNDLRVGNHGSERVDIATILARSHLHQRLQVLPRARSSPVRFIILTATRRKNSVNPPKGNPGGPELPPGFVDIE